MRLTLRTLLAYLDDTLEANEIREIGEKVAESDAAQELIARLKQVTRRRRLTAPAADGPEGVDPNDVAEYLDNELDADKVNDLEKQALESDVHLAEIAACHQILTLVLGEPALVPPKAKERMYGLVRGREANPKKKAQGPKKTNKEAVVDEEELALSSGWLRWVLPAAGAALVVLIALAVYQILPPTKPNKDPGPVAQGGKQADEPKGGDADKSDKESGEPKKPAPVKTDGAEKSKTPEGGAGKEVVEKPIEVPPVVAVPPPSKEVVVTGRYIGGSSGLPTLLAVRGGGQDEWKRIAVNEPVQTNETLMALPGFASAVKTQSGVTVLLRGFVRQLAVNPIISFLSDSAVTLHSNPNFDLDLTIQRGRVYLINNKEKGPAKVRMRFENEVWDLTLGNAGDKICVDLLRYYTPYTNHQKNESPKAECYLTVMKGDVDIKVDPLHTHNIEVLPPKSATVVWDSFKKVSGPFKHDTAGEAISEQPISDAYLNMVSREMREVIQRTQAGLKNVATLLDGKKGLRDALKEGQTSPDPAVRVVAIQCLASIDAIGLVCDSLSEEREGGAADRAAATQALQSWVNRGPGQASLLLDEKAGTGILIDKMYKKSEAEQIVQLLHPFLTELLDKEETYHLLARRLRSPRVAIAELGFRNLEWMSQGKIPMNFNAAWPLAQRERYSDEIEKMIEKGQLPPRLKK